MQRTFRALLVLAALLAIALVSPATALCKVRADSNSAPASEAELAHVHTVNATETDAASEIGRDATYGPAVGTSNKIQSAPKKRMKNKIMFDVTKPSAKSPPTSNNNNSPAGTASQQSGN